MAQGPVQWCGMASGGGGRIGGIHGVPVWRAHVWYGEVGHGMCKAVHGSYDDVIRNGIVV